MSESKKLHVVFDHDGGIDDLLSLLLLLRLPNIELLGVTITPADCYADDALLSTQKILRLCGKPDIPVAVGNVAGPNPFPPEWRAQPKLCHFLPDMLRVDSTDMTPSVLPAHEFMANLLTVAKDSVTVLMTGPATNLVHAVRINPAIQAKIEKVVWMGGAVDVKGNVAMHDHNGSAEWNAYWDPLATKTLIESDINLLMVPLDATNALPVNREFLCDLAAQYTPVSDFCGQLWAATSTAIPTYEFTYFLWDVLSTCMLSMPEGLSATTNGKISVSTSTPNAGQTYRDDQNGSLVSWVSSANGDAIRKMVIHYLSGEFDAKPAPFG